MYCICILPFLSAELDTDVFVDNRDNFDCDSVIPSLLTIDILNGEDGVDIIFDGP